VAIDRAEVGRIARLACLDLDDPAIDSLARDLEAILQHVTLLDEVDAARDEAVLPDLEPAAALRQDAVRPSLSQERALQNAPEAAQGFFRIPRVLD